MRRQFLALAFGALAVLAVVALLAETASAQVEPDNTRRSMGNLHPDSYTAGQAVQGSGRFTQRRTPIIVVPQPYYGGYPYHYRHRPYYGGYGYYPYYAPPRYYYGPYVFPPIILPAETLYGPQATRRFMGW